MIPLAWLRVCCVLLRIVIAVKATENGWALLHRIHRFFVVVQASLSARTEQRSKRSVYCACSSWLSSCLPVLSCGQNFFVCRCRHCTRAKGKTMTSPIRHIISCSFPVELYRTMFCLLKCRMIRQQKFPVLYLFIMCKNLRVCARDYGDSGSLWQECSIFVYVEYNRGHYLLFIVCSVLGSLASKCGMEETITKKTYVRFKIGQLN